MNYQHFRAKDDIGNDADFFLSVTHGGCGAHSKDTCLTLLICSERVSGKHTFYTSVSAWDFFKDVEVDYLFGKYGVEKVVDIEAFTESMLSYIVQSRWCKDISKEQAREAFRLVKNGKSDFWSEDAIHFFWKEHGMGEYLDLQHIPMKWDSPHLAFFDELWRQFVDSLDERDKMLDAIDANSTKFLLPVEDKNNE